MTPAPVDFTTVYTRNRLYCAIVLIFLLKSTTTTLFRGIYPFAEYFASDMGIPVGRFFLVLSIGELLGAAAPLLSPLSERLGSRKVLVVTGAANAVFSVLIGLGLSSLGLFVVAWCLYSLVKTLFFGAAGAFIGSFVPPNLQTRATGFVEFSWGFASFVGLTFIGFIVSVAPYGWMMHTTGIAMGIIAVLLYVTFFSKATRQPSPSSLCDNADTRMIDDRPVIGIELSAGYTTNHLSTRTDGDTVTNASRSPQHSAAVLQPSDATVADEPPAKPLLSGLAQFKIVFSDIGAVCLLVSGVICIVCASITFTNYAPWITELHGLSPSELGSASTAIGVAEVVGEIVVIAIGDRINPAICAMACCVTCVVFSLVTISVQTASLTANMTVLACYFVGIEAEFVFLLAAGTRVAKSAQTTMFLCIFSALQLARFVAALVVNPIWTSGGIVLTSVVTAVLQLVCLAFSAVLWKETRKSPISTPHPTASPDMVSGPPFNGGDQEYPKENAASSGRVPTKMHAV